MRAYNDLDHGTRSATGPEPDSKTREHQSRGPKRIEIWETAVKVEICKACATGRAHELTAAAVSDRAECGSICKLVAGYKCTVSTVSAVTASTRLVTSHQHPAAANCWHKNTVITVYNSISPPCFLISPVTVGSVIASCVMSSLLRFLQTHIYILVSFKDNR